MCSPTGPPISRNQGKRVYDTRRTVYNLGTRRASVKRFSRACTMLFALSADKSNSQFNFFGKGPLFLERVTYNVTVSEKTDHLALIQFVQYGPKALQRSRSRDFAISMPRCSTASRLSLTKVSAFS